MKGGSACLLVERRLLPAPTTRGSTGYQLSGRRLTQGHLAYPHTYTQHAPALNLRSDLLKHIYLHTATRKCMDSPLAAGPPSPDCPGPARWWRIQAGTSRRVSSNAIDVLLHRADALTPY